MLYPDIAPQKNHSVRRQSIFLLSVFLNLIIGFLIFFGAGRENTLASIMLLISFMLLSIVFSYIVASSRLRIVSFMLIMFWSYGMIMPGLYQVRHGIFPWYQMSVRGDLIVPAAIICIISILLYMIGYFSHQAVFKIPVRGNGLCKKDGFAPSVIVFVFAAVYSIYAVSKIGITPFLLTRQGSSILMADAGISTAGIGLLRTLPSALSISAFLVFSFDRCVRGNRTRANFFMVVLSSALMVIMNFPLSLPRFMMIAIAAIYGFTLARKILIPLKSTLYIAGPVLIYLVFPYLGGFNRYDDVSWEFVMVNPAESMLHGDFDGFQSIMNVLLLVDSEGISWGGRMLSAFLVMVPRSFWTGKYNPTGVDAAQAAQYDFLNISMPFPGELYADFGFLGVICGMFILGRIVAYLDFRTDGKGLSRFSDEEAMIGIILAAYMPILFRGALLAVIAPAFVSIVMILLWGFARRLEWARIISRK